MKIIVKVVKKICLAVIMLYGLNVALSSTEVIVPINLVSIGVVTALNIPGIIGLLIMQLII